MVGKGASRMFDADLGHIDELCLIEGTWKIIEGHQDGEYHQPTPCHML